MRLTPYAHAKLRFLRDLGPTEVGGFGISAADDPLLVEDVRLVPQRTDVVTVAFDDEGVADLFDELVDTGLGPERFARIWIHTHPGDSATPSYTDEETFARVFGRCDWAVMAVLARGGQRYARLRFGVGPGGQMRIPMCVDWAAPFDGSDQRAWEAEYDRCVQPIEAEPCGAGDPFEADIDEFGALLDQSAFDPAARLVPVRTAEEEPSW